MMVRAEQSPACAPELPAGGVSWQGSCGARPPGEAARWWGGGGAARWAQERGSPPRGGGG